MRVHISVIFDSASGNPAGGDDGRNRCPTARPNVREVVTYQPASRHWPFQW